MIEWPGVEEEELEQVTEKSVHEDPFHKNSFVIERAEKGGGRIQVKLLAEVELTPAVLEEMMSRPNFHEELAETIMQRLLLDMNVSLLPVMRFKIDEFKTRLLLLN